MKKYITYHGRPQYAHFRKDNLFLIFIFLNFETGTYMYTLKWYFWKDNKYKNKLIDISIDAHTEFFELSGFLGLVLF